jgi:hypothetical protein
MTLTYQALACSLRARSGTMGLDARLAGGSTSFATFIHIPLQLLPIDSGSTQCPTLGGHWHNFNGGFGYARRMCNVNRTPQGIDTLVVTSQDIDTESQTWDASSHTAG